MRTHRAHGNESTTVTQPTALKTKAAPAGLGVSPRRQEKVLSSGCSARLAATQRTRQMCVDGGERLCPSVPCSRFPQARPVGCAEIPSHHHVMEEKEVLDSRCILSPEPQLRLRSATASRLSTPRVHSSPETRTPAGKTDRSHRDCFCKRLSSRTARTWPRLQGNLCPPARNFGNGMHDNSGSRAPLLFFGAVCASS